MEVRERAGVSARETHGRKCAVSALGVEEKTFRAHWGARRERVGASREHVESDA